MKKKIFILFILAAILILPRGAFAAEDNTKIAAYPAGDNIVFDGSKVSLKTYNINNENYVKLRDVASLLKGTKAQFSVFWDKDSKSVVITQGQGHDEDFKDAVLDPNEGAKEGQVSDHKIIRADKTPLNLKGYLVAGNNYFRLRDLGRDLGFGVAYDYKTKTVLIDSENPDLKDLDDEKSSTGPIAEIQTKDGLEKLRILVYGFDQCPYCRDLKAYLDQNKIPYSFSDIRGNDEKIKEVYETYYKDLDYDRLYYPTTIITLETDGKSIDKAVVGFSKEMYDEIFDKIKNKAYFVENK